MMQSAEHQFHHRRCERLNPLRLEVDLRWRRVASRKRADLELLHRERLHDAHAADGLLQQRGHDRPSAPASDASCRAGVSRSARPGYTSTGATTRLISASSGFDEEHVDDQADQGDRLLKEIAHPRGDRGLDRVGIRHDAADHLPRRTLGEESMALKDDPLVQLVRAGRAPSTGRPSERRTRRRTKRTPGSRTRAAARPGPPCATCSSDRRSTSGRPA